MHFIFVSNSIFLNHISSHILQSSEKSLKARELRKMTVKILSGANFLSCLRRKSLLTDLLSSYDDDDDDDEMHSKHIIQISLFNAYTVINR